MRGSREAIIYTPFLQGKILSVSFITVGELYFWAEKKHWGEKRRLRLENILTNYVVIPYDSEIARCYAKVRAERDETGYTPFNWVWDLSNVKEGEHLLTVNVSSFKDQIGVLSRKVRVVK